MSTEQITTAIVAFVLANGATVYGVVRFMLARAIEYTHLQRDVKELRADIADLKAKHDKVQFDIKGVAQIARAKSPPTNS